MIWESSYVIQDAFAILRHSRTILILIISYQLFCAEKVYPNTVILQQRNPLSYPPLLGFGDIELT